MSQERAFSFVHLSQKQSMTSCTPESSCLCSQKQRCLPGGTVLLLWSLQDSSVFNPEKEKLLINQLNIKNTPNFYHRGVYSLRRQFWLLVDARLVLRNFGYPNILFKKYFPPSCSSKHKLAILSLCIFFTALGCIMEIRKELLFLFLKIIFSFCPNLLVYKY